MARQPTSLIGHMYAATRKTVGLMLAPVAFVGRASMQAAERLIPHGAAEVGSALFTGNAYAPPVLHSPEQGNVHGTASVPQQQEAAEATPPQQQAPGWGHQATWGFKELGHRPDAKIIDMQPQVESHVDYQKVLESAASRGGGHSQARRR